MKNFNKDTGATKLGLSHKSLQYYPRLNWGWLLTLLNKSFSAKKQSILSDITVGSNTQRQRIDQQDYVNCIYKIRFIHQGQKKL